MIFGVVYVHAAAHDQIGGMGTGFFDYFMGFFNYAALRVPVPLLAIVSGYLLFIADLDLRPVALWKKKFRTIAFPFFVFNFLAIALFFGLQHLIPDAIMRIDLLHASRYDWINALFGILDAPFDYPMYFMRDLLVLIALAPVFGLFIRRAPMLGLAIVAVVFYFNYDGYLVIRSTSAIMFYIGGVLAVKKYDLLAFDHYAAPMLALLVAICAGVVVLHVDNINYAALTGPFLVWPAFKYLKNTVSGAACRQVRQVQLLHLYRARTAVAIAAPRLCTPSSGHRSVFRVLCRCPGDGDRDTGGHLQCRHESGAVSLFDGRWRAN